MFELVFTPKLAGVAAILAASLAVFVWRLWHLFAYLVLGKMERRWEHMGRRLWGVVTFAVIQKRMFREWYGAVLHAFIFWGFVILLTTVVEFIGGGLMRDFAIPFIGGNPLLLLAQEGIAVLVIVGIAMAAFRRAVVKPDKLRGSNERDAAVILGGILAIILTLLLGGAVRFALDGRPVGAMLYRPASFALSMPFAGVDKAALGLAYEALWWGHIVALFGFLAYVPFSKHLHILTAFPNIFFRNLGPPGRLTTPKLEDAETFGAGKITDFTWKHLLDTYTCTECGRCQDACPAWNTGKPLSPKLLVMGLRDHLLATGDRYIRGAGGKEVKLRKPMVGGVIEDEVNWSCTTCMACVRECPVFIEHVDKIVDMRRNLVLSEGRMPEEVQRTFRNIETNYNPWGVGSDTREEWAEGLGVRVLRNLEAGTKVDFLLWVGCAGAFDARNRGVATAVVRILRAAGVDFGILGVEEKCTGDPARRMGNEYLAQTLIQGNVETLNRYGVKRILTFCPHCFNTLKNEYPRFGGRYSVTHHSEFIARLLKGGRVQVAGKLKGKAALHDSCYLGRYNSIFRAPRDIVDYLGMDIAEMRRNRDRSFCCGAGGGRVWMEERTGTRVNHARFEEAARTGAKTVATACPFCLIMFEDAAKAKGREDVKIRDIAEMVAEAMP